MEKLRTYKDFSTLVARKSENEEWALNRQKMCAHYVKNTSRRPEVKHG